MRALKEQSKTKKVDAIFWLEEDLRKPRSLKLSFDLSERDASERENLVHSEHIKSSRQLKSVQLQTDHCQKSKHRFAPEQNNFRKIRKRLDGQ